TAKLAMQIRRDLAVVDAHDGKSDQLVFRGRGDRVAALRLIAVLGGQANIDVLSGQVSSPAGHIHQKGFYPGRLDDDVTYLRDLPLEPPRRTRPAVSHRRTSLLSMGRHGCDTRPTPRSPACWIP